MNRNNDVPIKHTLIGKISIGIAFILVVIIINEFVQIFPTHKTKLQGSLILLPLFVAPIGVILGLIPLRKNKDDIAKWGLILNIILFLFPMLYMVLGTLIFGV
ncbi:MAG: hypothetical protein ACREV6_07260 [Clostridium sp.]|uniref:hypothetical protein n=1 Tax=Clostridium sp. TaxID=1506 RepID=UPI003D6C71B1